MSPRWGNALWALIGLWTTTQVVRAADEVGALPEVASVTRAWAPPVEHPLGEVIDPRPLTLEGELAARYAVRVSPPSTHTLEAWRATLRAAGVEALQGRPDTTPRLVEPPEGGPWLVVAPYGQQWVVAVPGVGVVVSHVDALPDTWATVALPSLQERPY